MARPVKDGLDYFPKDSDFYRNRKIRALIGRFGADGVALYDYILCEIYGDKGYYTEIDDSFRDIAAVDLGMSPEKIGLILDYLLDKSMLLDGTLFKAVKVLTSRGIQTRYQEAVRQRAVKRGVCVDGKLWLLNEAETESFIKVRHDQGFSEINQGFSEINQGFSEEKSLKKIKVNEMKEEISSSSLCARAQESTFVPIQTDQAVATVISDFLDRINPIAPKSCLDELTGYAKTLGAAVCCRAFDIALAEKITSWSYIRAILRNCVDKNIRCLADWEKADKEYENEKAQRVPVKKGAQNIAINEKRAAKNIQALKRMVDQQNERT